MSWRTVLAYEENLPDDFKIVTQEMVTSEELKPGDMVVPVDTFQTPDGYTFMRGQLYKVLRYDKSYPGGYIVEGDNDKAYIFAFVEKGNGGNFYKAIFDTTQDKENMPEEQQLGRWGHLPVVTLALLKKNHTMKRNNLIREIAAEGGSMPSTKFKIDVTQMLLFLTQNDYVFQTQDHYTLAPKGAKLLEESYG